MLLLRIIAALTFVGYITTSANAADPVESISEQAAHNNGANDADTICKKVGTGYFSIPGTTTCAALTGYASANIRYDLLDKEITVQTQYVGDAPFALYDIVDVPSSRAATRMRGEGQLVISTVTPTTKGVATSFLSINGLMGNGSYLMQMEQAYLNWNNITAGVHQSFFDTTPGYNYTEGISSFAKTPLVAYSYKFDDKSSLTLSVEDNNNRRTEEGVWALRAGQEIPDIVLSGRVNNDNSFWQASVAVTTLEDAGVRTCCNTTERDYGWAAQATAQFQFNYGEQSGRLLLGGAYTDGALSYLGPLSFASDYIMDSDGSMAKTQGISAIASYEHVWSANFKTAATLSGYQTWTRTQVFDWDTTGYQATVGLEYLPASNVVFGLEGNYISDSVQGTYFGEAGSRDVADYWRANTYLKRVF